MDRIIWQDVCWKGVFWLMFFHGRVILITPSLPKELEDNAPQFTKDCGYSADGLRQRKPFTPQMIYDKLKSISTDRGLEAKVEERKADAQKDGLDKNAPSITGKDEVKLFHANILALVFATMAASPRNILSASSPFTSPAMMRLVSPNGSLLVWPVWLYQLSIALI